MNTLNLRQALLKRMSVMARKLLLPEILRDLEALSTISEIPLSRKASIF